MRQDFLKQLQKQLQILKPAEADKYVMQYNDMIMEKIEQGGNEQRVVSELGDAARIGAEILGFYDDRNLLHQLQYVNPRYILTDCIILLFSAVCTGFLYLMENQSGQTLLWKEANLVALAAAALLFGILQLLYGAYHICAMKKRGSMLLCSLKAAFCELVIIIFALYLFHLIFISRQHLFIFTMLAVLLETVVKIVDR